MLMENVLDGVFVCDGGLLVRLLIGFLSLSSLCGFYARLPQELAHVKFKLTLADAMQWLGKLDMSRCFRGVGSRRLGM